MKVQLKTMAAMLLAVILAFGSGCTKDPENGGDNNGTENGDNNGGGNNGGGNNGGGNNGGGNAGGGTAEGMYVGIIGFNEALYTMPISLLDRSSEQSFSYFIDGLTMKGATALYHADNTALDWLQNATLPPDLINVSLITFTDGLDNGSTMLNSNYDSPEAFRDAVYDRIMNDRVQGQNINAYAIGLKGNDVVDEADFRQNLRKLSSDPYNNVFEVENMDEANERFREIASQLFNTTTTVNTNVKIPGGYGNGTVVRITFDDVTDANYSTQYIQATYSRENGQGKLSNINYYGLQSSSGNMVLSERQDGICYWYAFSDLKTLDGNPVTNIQYMQLWRYISSAMEWQPESEFTPSSYSDVSVERKSAVTILVLDCTESLGYQDFRKMQDAAIEFISVLNDNSGGDVDGGDGNGGNGDNGDNGGSGTGGDNGGGNNGGGGGNNGGGNGGGGVPLTTSVFEWVRQGSGYGSGLEEFGLEWKSNVSDRDAYARITPMEGVSLYMFDPRVWDETTTLEEKFRMFKNAPSSAMLSEYKNVSVWGSATYDDLIGTMMPDSTCHLIHVTDCVISAMPPYQFQ